MSMSLSDVVSLPAVERGSLREESVGAERASGAVSGEAADALGVQPGLPESVAGLSPAMLSTAAASLGQPGGELVSSGFQELDGLLPAGGIRRGSLIEWLPAGAEERPVLVKRLRQAGAEWKACDAGSIGSGAVTLSMAIAVQVARAAATAAADEDAASGHALQSRFQGRSARGRSVQGRRGAGVVPAGAVLVVDRSGWFYPPAVMRWLGSGQVAARVPLIVARPSRDDDEIWAIDQALRCGGVSAVVACPSASIVCSKVMRRWQLAARGSGAVGMFVRPWQCRRDPSWAEARLVVMPLQRLHQPVEAGHVGPLPGPPVAPRSEAVFRRWRVERLSSLLYGEGRSCELILDLERGEPPRAAGWQMERPQPTGAAAVVSQTALHRPSVERAVGVDVLPLRVAEGREPRHSDVAEGGKVFRKDGVACRAS